MSAVEPIPLLQPSPEGEDRLPVLAEEYVEVTRAAAEATARKKDLRVEILSLLGDREKVVAGRFHILAKGQTRTTLDRPAVEVGAAAAGFDLSPYYKVSSVTVLKVID